MISNINNPTINGFITLPSLFIIPKSVTKIDKYAFQKAKIPNFKFEENSQISSIYSHTFAYFETNYFVLPKSVINLGPFAFYGAKIPIFQLEENSQIELLDRYTFSNFETNSSFIIPETVTSLGNYVFDSSFQNIEFEKKGIRNQAAEQFKIERAAGQGGV